MQSQMVSGRQYLALVAAHRAFQWLSPVGLAKSLRDSSTNKAFGHAPETSEECSACNHFEIYSEGYAWGRMVRSLSNVPAYRLRTPTAQRCDDCTAEIRTYLKNGVLG